MLEPKGEAGDDDGQALVDAIDATYQTANDAMTAVEGLGGPDGTVAQNTAEIGLDADGNGDRNVTGRDHVAAESTISRRSSCCRSNTSIRLLGDVGIDTEGNVNRSERT